MKNYPILLFVALCVVGLAIQGCGSTSSTLDTAGVYGSGSAFGTNSVSTNGGILTTNAAVLAVANALYKFDTTLTQSVQGIDSFLAWEYQNRAILSQWPEIKSTADTLRANVPKWVVAATKQRDAYASLPNVANQNAATIAIAEISTALASSQSLIAAHTNAVPLTTK